MELDDYNKSQIEIFNKFNLWESSDFCTICCIVSKYKLVNNIEYFKELVVEELLELGLLK